MMAVCRVATILSVCILTVLAKSVPELLSINPSFSWDGADGRWSSFNIQVGTPPQLIRVLPSTSANAGSAPWVIIEPGCSKVNPSLEKCADLRGGLFESNKSSSWSTEGLENGVDGVIYNLPADEELQIGRDGNGSYGYDTVSLGIPGSGLPSLQHQLVAGVWDDKYFVGQLGLSPLPTNFSNLQDPQLSVLGALVNQSLVPSASWAYTAGAYYRDVFGSLIFGGYDETRFQANNQTFAFDSMVSRDLTVSLRSITYDTAGASPLLTSSVDIFIDSLVTEMWLPVETCNAFQQQFNLTWNPQGQLYLIDEVAHAALVAQNPSFTFTLGQSGSDSGGTVDIVLPYAAFDQVLSDPIVSNATRWFPIKRAQNASQLFLGRTFLQEAYVIADYDRRTFSVSQALSPDSSVEQRLIAIHRPSSGVNAGVHITTAKLAGLIALAVIVSVLCVAALLWCLRRSRKASRKREGGSTDAKELSSSSASHCEVDASEYQIYEVDSRQQVPELQSGEGFHRHELETREVAQELYGSSARFSWQ
ncbi:hypothetical protein CBER1_05421 [Cercospora berteroae]|uniref:Peptidase A1 domain-containing protein n=1 Tax=Cercospora berteroae TaxID=357750 RepID=A0A2S6C626_9PEZI|nr:hypothetical protein CBER1_05421 [Cercospora berteroae]